MSGAIGARNFSTAILSDANLRFPRGKVRINPGVGIDVTPDALVISGPGGRQLLRCGAEKGTLVARLLQHGLDPTTGELDVDTVDNKLLALLHAGGALESVPETRSSGPLDPLAGYLAGSRDSSRRFGNGQDLNSFVAGQQISVAATGRLRDVVEYLGDSGAVVTERPMDVVFGEVGFAGAHVFADRFLDPRVGDDACVAHIAERVIDGHKVTPGWLVIAAVVHDHILRLALRTDRWFGNAPDLCETCVESIFDQVIDDAANANRTDLRTACALFAQEIADLTAQVNQRPADTALRAISGGGRFEKDVAILETLAQESPCADCHSADGSGHRTQIASYAFVSEFSERHIQDPKGHQAHYLDANLAAQARPRVSATPADTSQSWDGHSEDPDLAPTLRAIRYAVGIRPASGGPKVSRFTASGGNMGSTAAVLEVPGSAGIRRFLYDDQTDRFVELATGRPPIEAPEVVGRPAIHLIAGIGRLGPKYGHLAYRVSMADAGAALATVQEFARAHGLEAELDWSSGLTGEELSPVLVGEGRPAVTVRLRPGVN